MWLLICGTGSGLQKVSVHEPHLFSSKMESGLSSALEKVESRVPAARQPRGVSESSPELDFQPVSLLSKDGRKESVSSL